MSLLVGNCRSKCFYEAFCVISEGVWRLMVICRQWSIIFLATPGSVSRLSLQLCASDATTRITSYRAHLSQFPLQLRPALRRKHAMGKAAISEATLWCHQIWLGNPNVNGGFWLGRSSINGGFSSTPCLITGEYIMERRRLVSLTLGE